MPKFPMKLQNQLNKTIREYIKLFEQKHQLEFEFWVADRTGTIACFSNEYYLSFDDIRTDLELNVPKHLFLQWYDQALEQAMENKPTINYTTFLKIQNLK